MATQANDLPASAFTPDNKVNPEFIQQLMDKVSYHLYVPEGRTTTVAVAFMGDLCLSVGVSNVVDEANYNEQTGQDVATRKAADLAVDKLFELYGFELRTKLFTERLFEKRVLTGEA